MKNTLRFLPVLFLLAACSGDDESDDATTPQKSAETLYNEARTMVDEGDVKESIKAFEDVERQYPASKLATDAQVMAAYSAYKVEDYDQAVATLERFVKLYPTDESTPYAYYLIALCYYEQISDVARDQKITQQAMQALRDVVRRFPGTEYERDAKIKLDLTEDHLAGKEMQVGRYYLKRGDTLAAINRFRYVVENYQTTSHVPEALHRLVETYLALGVKDEAQRYAAVLGANFPDSIWYRDSYKMMTGSLPETAQKEEESSSWLPF
ncbi:MAG: outer membrane protein assembly factor BamD [Alphaproteobacteria bacterium]|nr:outer membrane protein assembly factor BamD [Alphaproteobacteria bacterium]